VRNHIACLEQIPLPGYFFGMSIESWCFAEIISRNYSRVENEIIGVQAVSADTHQQQTIVVTEIDKSIVIVVD
jgi:hypothetical protein